AYAAQPGGPGPVLPTEVPGAAPGRSGRVVAIVLAVAIVVAGITWGGVYAARRIGAAVKHGGSVFGTGSGGGGALGGKSDGGDLKQFNGSPITISGSGVAGAVVGADAVYYATVTTGHTNVRAVPLPGTTGGPSWQQTPQLEPASLAMTLVNGLLILDGKSDNTANGKDVRVVLDAKTGKTRWKGEWSTFWQHDIAYLGTDVIFTNTFDNYVKRVRLTDGHTVWTHPEPADILADPYAKVPLAWPASIGTPIAAVPRSGKDAELPFQEPLVADGSRVVVLYSDDSTGEVLDTRTGHPLVRPGSLPLKADGIDDPWTVYDGLVIGADKGSAGLVGSGVGDLKQKWRYPLPAGADVRLVKACGQHLVCVSSEVGSGYQVMAVDTRNGTAAWSKPLAVDQEPVWYLAGQRVVYGDGTFASVGRNGAPASVLDPGKGTASPLGDSVSAYGGDGRYQSLVQTRVVSGRVDWLVSMVDIDTGKQTGWLDTGQSNTAPKVSVTGTGLAVLSGGGRLYLAQASGLAAR
ncbi:MAG TPA: hypothetical protein VJT31_40275, partial [Rugosimonospora sp.]|nr:hypothetical protein [Rugosimonospora sp.]